MSTTCRLKCYIIVLPSIKERTRTTRPCNSPSMMSSAPDQGHRQRSAPSRAAVSSPASTPRTWRGGSHITLPTRWAWNAFMYLTVNYVLCCFCRMKFVSWGKKHGMIMFESCCLVTIEKRVIMYNLHCLNDFLYLFAHLDICTLPAASDGNKP